MQSYTYTGDNPVSHYYINFELRRDISGELVCRRMPAFVAAPFHRGVVAGRGVGVKRGCVAARAARCCAEWQRPSTGTVRDTEVQRARLELAATRRKLAALRALRKDVDERRRLRLAARAPLLTMALAVTLCGVYAAGAVWAPLRGWLVAHGGVGGVAVLAWQPWRMLTAALLHRDFLHLLHNVWVLAALGCAAEMVYGAPAFAALFGAGAVGGAIVAALARPARVNMSVGASGALHALAGALMAHLRLNRRALGKRAAATTLCALGAATLVALAAAWTATGVDFAAHFGGLLVGTVVGAILAPVVRRVGNVARVKRAGWWKSVGVGVGVVGVGMALLVARLCYGV